MSRPNILTLVIATLCLVIIIVLSILRSTPRLSDPRLHGTWISDRQRTLEAVGSEETDDSREKLGALFGKLRITYSETSYTTEMDDTVDTMPYSVVGIDDHSVVIRDDSPDPDMEFLGLSTFSKIHFEGDDAYWLTTEIGGYREYFKRLPYAQP